MVGHQTWPGSKVQEEDEIDEELEDEEEDEECANVQQLRAMHHHHHRDTVHGEASHWVARQPHQVEIHHPWPKEIGELTTLSLDPGLQNFGTSQNKMSH